MLYHRDIKIDRFARKGGAVLLIQTLKEELFDSFYEMVNSYLCCNNFLYK
jgi:hypothetical protein